MNRYLNIFSFISVGGTLLWTVTDVGFFFILTFQWFIIPSLIGAAVTLGMTISRVIQYGFRNVIFSSLVHGFGIVTLCVVNLRDGELFKSETVLEANLVDDLSGISIKLRKDQTFETTSYGMFGYEEHFIGEYILRQDTIIFLDAPYSNDFIPNKVIIDRLKLALYFMELHDGQLDRTKDFATYFQIRKLKI